MGAIRSFTDRLISLSAIIGSAGLLFELTVILIDVIGRATGSPLFGSQDLITMSLVIVIFGAMALCDRNGGHIVIDIFEQHFPPAFNRFIDIISAFMGAAIFALLAWVVFDSARLSQMLHLSTNLLNLPKAWFQWSLSAFSLLTAVGMALRGFELAMGVRDVRQGGFHE